MDKRLESLSELKAASSEAIPNSERGESITRLSKYRKRRKTVLVVIAAIILIAYAAMWIVANNIKQIERERGIQELDTIIMLQDAEDGFYQQMSIVERENSGDGIYYTGVIGDELDILLVYLVDSYNADPSQEAFITIEDVRYYLTEGLAEAARYENRESPFRKFLKWTGVYANLVYTSNLYDANGNIVRDAGAEVPKRITNYGYAISRNVSSDIEYSWEWKKRQQEQGEASWASE